MLAIWEDLEVACRPADVCCIGDPQASHELLALRITSVTYHGKDAKAHLRVLTAPFKVSPECICMQHNSREEHMPAQAWHASDQGKARRWFRQSMHRLHDTVRLTEQQLLRFSAGHTCFLLSFSRAVPATRRGRPALSKAGPTAAASWAVRCSTRAARLRFASPSRACRAHSGLNNLHSLLVICLGM